MVVTGHLRTALAGHALALACVLSGCGQAGVPSPAPGAGASRATPSQSRSPRLAQVWQVMAQRTPRKRATPSQQRPIADERVLHAEVSYDFFGQPRDYER